VRERKNAITSHNSPVRLIFSGDLVLIFMLISSKSLLAYTDVVKEKLLGATNWGNSSFLYH
jgi:hypothetical protein